MTDETVFTVEEATELAEIQQTRKRLIKKLTETEGVVPLKGTEQVMLLGLLDGADRSTLTRAKMRQQTKRDENTTNVIKMVGEALKSVNARTYRPAASAIEREIPLEHAQRDYVPGEQDIGIDPVQITQLMGS